MTHEIRQLKDDVLAFAKHHCKFHYQGSYEYFNLGCGLLKIGMLKDAINNFTQSIQVYKENADSHYARGFVYFLLNETENANIDFMQSFKYRNTFSKDMYITSNMDNIPYNQIKSIENFNFINRTNENVEYEDLQKIDIALLYEHANIAKKSNNYADFVSIYSSIIQLTSKLHFDYHVNLANKYFKIAQLYQEEGQYYEAIFFCEKACETESNNLNNVAYQNLLSSCKISVNQDICAS